MQPATPLTMRSWHLSVCVQSTRASPSPRTPFSSALSLFLRIYKKRMYSTYTTLEEFKVTSTWFFCSLCRMSYMLFVLWEFSSPLSVLSHVWVDYVLNEMEGWFNAFLSCCRCQNESAHKDFKKAVGAIHISYCPEASELVIVVTALLWLLNIYDYIITSYSTSVLLFPKLRLLRTDNYNFLCEQSTNETTVKRVSLLSDMHLRNIRTKLLLMSRNHEATKHLEVSDENIMDWLHCPVIFRRYLSLFVLRIFVQSIHTLHNIRIDSGEFKISQNDPCYFFHLQGLKRINFLTQWCF